jgi:hypothetical protein
VTCKRKKPSERAPFRSPKQQRLDREQAVQGLLLLPEPSGLATASSSLPSDSPNCDQVLPVTEEITTPAFSSVGTSCHPDLVEKETQTETRQTSEMVCLRIENKILENKQRLLPSSEAFKINKPKHKIDENTKLVAHASYHDSFCVESLKNDDKKFKFYTGLTYVQFSCLWDMLGKSTSKVNFWNCQVSNPDKTPSKRPGRKRVISPINQLFMTLVRLRLGLLHQDLAYRFHTNTRQVSTIIITWIQLLYKQFSGIRQIMFASRQTVRKYLPKCFKKYKNIRCIIDCTEVQVQAPGNFEAQGNQYSSYKGYTSYKFLIAVAPNGAIVYVSDAFEGSISDKEIVKQSGFLNYLEPGDVIMADRGFLIDDMLNERQVRLIRPPFLGTRHRFTPQEEALTKDIAKHRIHVERSIERLKKFKILQRVIPSQLQPVFSQIVFIIACLVNFQDPLVK